MISLILGTATRILFPLLLLFSVFLLLRGHNEPGGGFAGGLVAGAAFVLWAISNDPANMKRALRFEPRSFIGGGLLIALLSGLPSLVGGRPYLTGIWGYLYIPNIMKLKLGTPLFFDIGVYLVVIGVVLMILIPMEEEAETAQMEAPDGAAQQDEDLLDIGAHRTENTREETAAWRQ